MKVASEDKHLLDKIEDAMWGALDEGSFSWGINAGDLVEHLAVLALGAVKTHQALGELAEMNSTEVMGDDQ
jgi:hypothetical protein